MRAHSVIVTAAAPRYALHRNGETVQTSAAQYTSFATAWPTELSIGEVTSDKPLPLTAVICLTEKAIRLLAEKVHSHLRLGRTGCQVSPTGETLLAVFYPTPRSLKLHRHLRDMPSKAGGDASRANPIRSELCSFISSSIDVS
jgi:hypothetical protein